MKLTRTLKFHPVLFSFIPLVNVIFLVVIFFAMSSRFVLQPGMAVALPASAFTLSPQQSTQIVSITSAPIPAIYHRDEKVSVEELRQRLGSARMKERSLIIKADRSTPYDLVVQIMNEGLKLGYGDARDERGTPMIRAEADSGLTFSWGDRERFSLLLFACVFFSILAHAATFFLFQVVYPQRVTIPPPESRVTLLTGATPEGEALLRWIDAEDPALVASAVGQAPTWLLEVPYIPSYATVRPLPRLAPEAPTTVQFPPAKPPLDFIRSADRKPVPPMPVQQKLPTSIRFSGALATRAPSPPPPLELSVRAPDPLQAATLLIGVNETGEVRYHFIQQSSGNAAMDTRAAECLSRVRFAPAASPIEWSIATVNWGDDAYR